MTWSTPMCLRKAHLAAPPADPMTVCPLSLAIWHTTDPTAPAATETNTTTPGLSVAILSKPTQAVSPGMPATPRNAWGGSPNVSSFCRGSGGCVEPLAPAEYGGDEIARVKSRIVGSGNFADRAALQRITELEGPAPAVHGRVGRGEIP